eukprot:CAMPEP_0179860958 /NCGR_PEP_ID=MMETSP0982-20121206/13954_1 /TAXON_ID=483367 /ORGANISM="non described non described, Strain CCMP 2436" /LENGTH=189 /DNA_ID=CAMNT_0021748365 /DNA_START=343 /DNA_END=913 /DNA_ORIENTATION=-
MKDSERAPLRPLTANLVCHALCEELICATLGRCGVVRSRCTSSCNHPVAEAKCASAAPWSAAVEVVCSFDILHHPKSCASLALLNALLDRLLESRTRLCFRLPEADLQSSRSARILGRPCRPRSSCCSPEEPRRSAQSCSMRLGLHVPDTCACATFESRNAKVRTIAAQFETDGSTYHRATTILQQGGR